MSANRIESCTAVAKISITRISLLLLMENHLSVSFSIVGTNAESMIRIVMIEVIRTAALSCALLPHSSALAVIAAMIRIGM